MNAKIPVDLQKFSQVTSGQGGAAPSHHLHTLLPPRQKKQVLLGSPLIKLK